MKTISPLLNGVYRMPKSMDQTRAASADLQRTAISLERIRGKQALLKALARAMNFPATFGNNWDALSDCLQDLSWLPEHGHLLVLTGLADLAAAAPADLDVLLDILGAAAVYWRQRERVFVVLADGASGLPEFPAS